MRNIFFEKSYTKCGGEAILKIDDFKNHEIKIENISGLTVWFFIQFVLLYLQVDEHQRQIHGMAWVVRIPPPTPPPPHPPT